MSCRGRAALLLGDLTTNGMMLLSLVCHVLCSACACAHCHLGAGRACLLAWQQPRVGRRASRWGCVLHLLAGTGEAVASCEELPVAMFFQGRGACHRQDHAVAGPVLAMQAIAVLLEHWLDRACPLAALAMMHHSLSGPAQHAMIPLQGAGRLHSSVWCPLVCIPGRQRATCCFMHGACLKQASRAYCVGRSARNHSVCAFSSLLRRRLASVSIKRPLACHAWLTVIAERAQAGMPHTLQPWSEHLLAGVMS